MFEVGARAQGQMSQGGCGKLAPCLWPGRRCGSFPGLKRTAEVPCVQTFFGPRIFRARRGLARASIPAGTIMTEASRFSLTRACGAIECASGVERAGMASRPVAPTFRKPRKVGQPQLLWCPLEGIQKLGQPSARVMMVPAGI